MIFNKIMGLPFLIMITLNSVNAGEDSTDATAAALNKPYVTVNGVAQPTAWAELIFRAQRQRGVPDSEALRQSIREVLVNQAVLESAARKAELDKAVLVQGQIELARREILVRVWQQDFLGKFKVSDKDIRAEYARYVARLGDKEYQIRHLLVNDKATAKLLIDKISNGAKLKALAMEYSLDKSTKEQGGLVEWNSLANLLPAAAEAVVKLKNGEHNAQPVHSELGWHVIQLADTRSFTAPALDKIKPQVVKTLAQRALEARIKELRDKAKVE